MTSLDNDDETKQYFEKNKYFGLDPAQVHFVMQGLVPSVVPQDGRIKQDPKNPYKVIMGAHGHGDIHKLMYDNGHSELLKREGRYAVFVQDTNPSATNAVLPMLSESIKKRYVMNFMGVARDA